MAVVLLVGWVEVEVEVKVKVDCGLSSLGGAGLGHYF
jgi:hypothetical protein